MERGEEGQIHIIAGEQKQSQCDRNEIIIESCAGGGGAGKAKRLKCMACFNCQALFIHICVTRVLLQLLLLHVLSVLPAVLVGHLVKANAIIFLSFTGVLWNREFIHSFVFKVSEKETETKKESK